MAARPLGQLRQDRRRAEREGRSRRRAQGLPGQPRHRPEARRAGPRQRRAGSATSRSASTRSATCRARRAISTARSRPTRTASPSARSSPRRTPATPSWQRDLSVSFEKIGDVQSAKGDLDGALKAYQDSLAIAEKLAAQDPGNAGWQRDLSVSFRTRSATCRARRAISTARSRPTRTASPSREARRAGPRQRRLAARPLGQLRARSATCRARRAISTARSRPTRTASPSAEKLAAQDPGNAELAARPLGQLREDRRRAEREGRSRRRAQGLPGQPRHREKLAAQDPGNAGWQRDLIVSHWRLADLAEQRREPAEARRTSRPRSTSPRSWTRAAGWRRPMRISSATIEERLARVSAQADRTVGRCQDQAAASVRSGDRFGRR